MTSQLQQRMLIIYLTGLLFLDPPLVASDGESEGQSLLQEILKDLQKEQNLDYPSTSTTQTPLGTSPKMSPSTARTSNTTFTFNISSLTSPSPVFYNLTVSKTTKGTEGNDSDDDSIQSLISFLNNSETSQTNKSDASLQQQIQDIFSKTLVTEKTTPSGNILTTATLKSTSWSYKPEVAQDCVAKDILQSICTEDLPSLVKIANIWDIYYVLFSDDVMNELLLNCASGEWCIRDEFDIFRAKMAEKADMVLNSAMFSEACGQVSLGCLQSAVQHFESCSIGPRLNFTLESVRLMCSVRNVTSSNMQCTSQILAALHVTLMDILRKENKKQDLNVAFENDKCRSTEALMTRTYLCTRSKCQDSVNELLSSFTPWSWFIGDVDTLKVTCHDDNNNTCVSRDMVFMIDDEALPIPIPPTTQTNAYESPGSGFVDIQSTPVALAGFGTGAFVMVVGLGVFIIFFIKRHRLTSRKHEYKPLETNEP